MRQKRIKGVTRDLLQEKGVITEKTMFDLTGLTVNLEIGSGKGKFISSLAKNYQNQLFFAFEKNISVCYHIAQKQIENKLNNLVIVFDDAVNLGAYFKEKTIDHVFINFADPWPKPRHHKRRLTFRTFLACYYRLLKDNGTIQFRTDHYDFFSSTITYIKHSNLFKIIMIDEDLAESEYMTEYESKKRVIGKIYQLIGEKNG